MAIPVDLQVSQNFLDIFGFTPAESSFPTLLEEIRQMERRIIEQTLGEIQKTLQQARKNFEYHSKKRGTAAELASAHRDALEWRKAVEREERALARAKQVLKDMGMQAVLEAKSSEQPIS